MEPIQVNNKKRVVIPKIRNLTDDQILNIPSLNLLSKKAFMHDATIELEQALAKVGVIVPMPYLRRLEEGLINIGRLYYKHTLKRGLF